MSDILVVYYSRSGKTRSVAEKLRELLSADLAEITEEKDRSGAFGYLAACKDSMMKRPADLRHVPSPTEYRIMVIGMPVWAFQPPPAIRAYLQAVDLTDQSICGFCTYDGSGGDRTLDALHEMLPNGLAERFQWKKPKPDDPRLLQALADWAEKIRALATM